MPRAISTAKTYALGGGGGKKITKIRNEKGVITTNPMDMRRLKE